MTFDQEVLLKVIQHTGLRIQPNRKLKGLRAIHNAVRRKQWWFSADDRSPQWLDLRRGGKTVVSLRLGAKTRILKCLVYVNWRASTRMDMLATETLEVPIAQPDSFDVISTFVKKWL